MDSWVKLHYEAVRTRPSQSNHDSEYSVAVLRHDVSWKDPPENRFLWIPATGTHDVEAIEQMYKTELKPDVDVTVICHIDFSTSTTIRNLNNWADNIIVMQAVKKSANEQARQVVNRCVEPPRHRSASNGPRPRYDGVSSSREESDQERSAASKESQSFPLDVPALPSSHEEESYHTALILPGIEAKEATVAPFEMLQKLLRKQDAELLEDAVEQALVVSDELQTAFARDHPTMQRLEAWKRRAKLRPRVVIGLFGLTGAGKSSMVNATIGEERVVPTSSMRASTSVVTEVSYNHSNDPAKKYQATIEPMTTAEWRKELKNILREIKDDDGDLSPETRDPETIAGIAWAKLQAVYPNRTDEELSRCTLSDLMKDDDIMDFLGQTKSIFCASPDIFHDQIKPYIDCKKKIVRNGTSQDPVASTFEYWPLIKIVRIRVKADALSTGAVLVDLPGTHDSNAARAKVAVDFKKECDSFWVVTPITRAVSEKAAKDLLGEGFKRQLQLDGGLYNVTIICSKTDQIENKEVAEELNIQAEIRELEEKVQKCEDEQTSLSTEENNLKETKRIYDESHLVTSDQIYQYEKQRKYAKAGRPVYVPVSVGQKRKRDKILTEEELQEILDDLHETTRGAKKVVNEYELKIEENGTRKRELEAEKSQLKTRINLKCIQGRNDYCKEVMLRDYVKGIKELSEDILKDDDEIEKLVQVFCVSSKEFLKSLRLPRKDHPAPGFEDPEVSELPKVQAHCKRLTEPKRISTCQVILLEFLCLLTEILTFASKGEGENLPQYAKAHAESKCILLENRLLEKQGGCLRDCRKKITDLIKLLRLEVNEAIERAPGTSRKWGIAQKKGGLAYPTYKATISRDGVFQPPKKKEPHDFNQQLLDPLDRSLAGPWGRTFRDIPSVLKAFGRNGAYVIQESSHSFAKQAQQDGIAIATSGSVSASFMSEIAVFERYFEKDVDSIIKFINKKKRDDNRVLHTSIVDSMHPAFKRAKGKKGKGAFKDMKEETEAYVDQNRHEMLDKAVNDLKKALNETCDEIDQRVNIMIAKTVSSMKQMYLGFLCGSPNSNAAGTMEDVDLKSKIRDILDSVDKRFEALAITQSQDPIEDVNYSDNVPTDFEASPAGPSQSAGQVLMKIERSSQSIPILRL